MKKLRHINFDRKIFLSIFLLIFLFGIVLLATNFYFFSQNQQKDITNRLHTTHNAFEHSIAQAEEKALYAAIICANIDIAQKAYIEYYTSEDITLAATMLRESFRPINRALAQFTGVKPYIHYHLQDHSLARLWEHQYTGQELLTNRQVLRAVQQDLKAVKGIETDESGLVVRGIVPVINHNNQDILGSVEVSFTYQDIVAQQKYTKDEELAVLLHNSQLATAKDIKQSDKKIYIGDYVLLSRTSPKFKLSTLSEAQLNQLQQKKEYHFKEGDYHYGLWPITDLNGKMIGLVAIQLNQKEQTSGFQNFLYLFLGMILLLLVFIIIVIYVLINLLVKRPVHRIADRLQVLAKGDLPDRLPVKTHDIIGQMGKNFNNMLDNLSHTADFAREIEQGNYDARYEASHQNDRLGHALLDMRESLKNMQETEQKRRIEDDKRNWHTQGVAKFSDILRRSTDNLNDYAYHIIKNMVTHLKANQGALFILNTEDQTKQYLELLASVAYDRRKFINKKIDLGEGMTGTCAREQRTINITKLPDDYIKISSGLGESNPKNLLMVPLKTEDEMLGVLELASFETFEDHEIKFAETIATGIAASLRTAQMNEKTNELLAELRQQAEVSSSQDEEMRQNMEELQATQEEMQRQRAEAEHTIQQLEREVARLKNILSQTVSQKELLATSNDVLQDELNKLKDGQD